MSALAIYNVALTLVPGIGCILARKILDYCGSSEAVFSESKSNLLKIPGIGPKVAQSIISNRSNIIEKATSEIEFAKKYNIKIISILDNDYPQRLLTCDDAPVLLYFKGSNCDFNKQHIVNIIGTRNMSDLGRELTEKLIVDLKPYNPIIVSGLAYGIDTIAHRASVKEGLQTIGVLAHGLNQIYPSLNRDLAESMLSSGGLLTEFVSSSKISRENFPKRNRIVAGMCEASIVVEAGLNSGALITADLANDYNRDVFAFPGRSIDESFRGCNSLIKKNSAMLVESASDIINILGWGKVKDTSVKKKDIQLDLFNGLNTEEQKIVLFISDNKEVHIDDIIVNLNIQHSILMKLLLSLELKNIIKQLSGNRYKLV